MQRKDPLITRARPPFSLSSAGAATYNIEAFDGKEIAGSGEYWNYYGYLAEDRDFMFQFFPEAAAFRPERISPMLWLSLF